MTETQKDFVIPSPPPDLPCLQKSIPAPPPDLPGLKNAIPAPPPDIGDYSGTSRTGRVSGGASLIPGEKRRIQTNYRLPVLNWSTVSKAQVDGTIFSEIDDENIFKVTPYRSY